MGDAERPAPPEPDGRHGRRFGPWFWLPLPAFLVVSAWSLACLWIDGPFSRWAAGALTSGLTGMLVASAVLVRPLGRAWTLAGLLLLGVQVWWLSIPPSNDRDWRPEVARHPSTRIEGDRVTIRNVRNFHYRDVDDFDARWETRTYDLDRLRGLDLFVSHWGAPLIAHTILSWEFEDAPPLAISIETRKERSESYSAIRGFFRQYELYYVVADERDVIGVRARMRGERVELYRVNASADVARRLLLDYLEEIDRLEVEPRWYNAIFHNCTTTIRYHTQHIGAGAFLDWRLFVNGYLDEMAYEIGTIDNRIAFDELKRRSDITARARAAGRHPDFSRLIRVDLPGGHFRE